MVRTLGQTIDAKSPTVVVTIDHGATDAHAKLATIQIMTGRLRFDRGTIPKMSERLWLSIIETIGNFQFFIQKSIFSASTSDLTTEPRYTWWKGVMILSIEINKQFLTRNNDF